MFSADGVVLYAAFAATGVGLTLPGILLPALMQEWKLQDSGAGLLFLCAWCGSALGALLVRGHLKRTLSIGGIFIGIGATGLALLPGWNFFWLMIMYGMGLGLTMTSISLLRQRVAGLRNKSEVEMVRLNLLWAAGACVCPALSARALRSGNTHPLLIELGFAFVTLTLWVSLFLREESPQKTDLSMQLTRRTTSVFFVPLPLLLMLFLVTGIEAASGGWLTTYAKREHHDLGLTVAAPTCLWAGLLLSRALWSIKVVKFRSISIVQGSLWGLSASTLLMVAGTSGWAVLIAAFGIGFSLGPIYPLLLARALSFQPTGSLFFIAGLGSAALPWLTGLLSQMRTSLKSGLLVPMIAALVMLMLALIVPEREAEIHADP
jgi:fucose permease